MLPSSKDAFLSCFGFAFGLLLFSGFSSVDFGSSVELDTFAYLAYRPPSFARIFSNSSSIFASSSLNSKTITLYWGSASARKSDLTKKSQVDRK